MKRRPWQPALSPNAWLRWDAVAARLPTEATDVLEVGCGRGGFAVRLAERYRYTGVEPDQASAKVARWRLERFGFDPLVLDGEIQALPAEAAFDLVCAFEVLEHIDDDRAALSNWFNHLRPGGVLLLTTPAGMSRFSIADEMVGHFRRYEIDEMARLLAEVGLEHITVTTFGSPFAYGLETIRKAIARSRTSAFASASRAERSATSGRLLQPGDGPLGAAIWLGMIPWRLIQRALPGRGPCLIAIGRRPVSQR